jgi:hypothetical protein
LGTLQTLRDEAFSPATAEKYRLDQLLPSWSWEWYGLIALLIVISVLLESAYRAVANERATITSLQSKLDQLTSEYTYSLTLDRIDQRETRQLDQQGATVIKRDGCLLLRLRNTISRPIEYHVRKIIVNGTELTNFSSRGSVISGQADTTFYTPEWPLDPSERAMASKLNYLVEYEIDYGQPGIMQRTRHCIVRVEAFPKSQTTDMIYERNEDVARQTSQS